LIIGASGSTYGIMVYAAFMAPTSRSWFFGIFPVQLRILVGILVFAGLYRTMLTLRHGGSDGVAHGAHLGGALWGFLAFRYFRGADMSAAHRPVCGGRAERWRRARRTRRIRADQAAQETLDGLLDKVHREGMNKLTAAERRFLERASRDAKRK
jgi:hypothetical protein